MTTTVVITLFLVLLAGALVRSTLKRRKEAAETRRLNSERQAFIQSRLDQIGALLENPSKSAAELQSESEALLTEIRLIDLDGNLLPLIEDTELYIEEQVASRST